MKKYKIVDYDYLKRDYNIESYLQNETLKLFNKNGYNYDIDDILKMFLNNGIKVFLINEEYQVKGLFFSNLYNGYNDNQILHCNKIIIDPSYQEQGLSKELLYYQLKKYDPDIITLKTNNPRCFELFSNIPYKITYYPNLHYIIPNDVYNIVYDNDFNGINRNMVLKDEYASIQRQQNVRNNNINKLFMNIYDYDAQVMAIIMHDDKIKLNNKVYIKQ